MNPFPLPSLTPGVGDSVGHVCGSLTSGKRMAPRAPGGFGGLGSHSPSRIFRCLSSFVFFASRMIIFAARTARSLKLERSLTLRSFARRFSPAFARGRIESAISPCPTLRGKFPRKASSHTPPHAAWTPTKASTSAMEDPSSLSNFNLVSVQHQHLELDVDFSARRISGVARIEFDKKDGGVTHLHLDTVCR